MSITYKLPKLKEKKKSENSIQIDEPVYPDSYDRRVHMPISKEQVAALNVGSEETIILKGKVTELESSERDEGKNRNSVTLVITSIEVEGKNDMEKLLDEGE